MRFHFLTIFPNLIEPYVGESILKRASEKKLVSFEVKNIREFSLDKHRKTDDRPYGGGPGMVMTAEPILRAIESLRLQDSKKKMMKALPSSRVPNRKVKYIMLSPSGKAFTNAVAKKWVKQYTDIVFICGRYEGVDDRVRKILKADEYSIGDYTITGGELAALVMADAIARQIPGVLGKGESIEENRIASSRVYTRPETLLWPKGKVAKKYKVPKVLIEGHHKKIDEWRVQNKNPDSPRRER